MLKICADEEERRGGALLAWYAGDGAAKVFEREAEAILLERVTGERTFARLASEGEDDVATSILCNTAISLHAPRPVPPPEGLVPLESWLESLRRVASDRAGVFATAERTSAALLRSPREIVTLHGDFHHGNVLDGGERGWLAIDPKGLSGERTFEYANLFRNPTAEIALTPGRLEKRLSLVSQRAKLEPQRLLRWVFAYAVLGAAWSLQDGQDPGPGLAIAERAAAELQ
jgi:streptomycin 6-kinase